MEVLVMSDLLSNSERLTQVTCGLLAEKLQNQGLKLAIAENWRADRRRLHRAGQLQQLV